MSLKAVQAVAVTRDDLRERADQSGECYTTADVLQKLRMARRTFFHLKRTGQLPCLEELRPRLGRVVRYRKDLIDQWCAGDWHTAPARRFFTPPRLRAR